MEPLVDRSGSILIAALEIESYAERRQFLERVCAGDLGLLRRIEDLLEDHFRAGNFLESPALQSLTVDSEQQPGAVIGPYKLVEQIGQGGFGVVFLAEQTHPVRRKVALKVIKPGMDTKHVVARFEAERQALALMDHPNIAHVHDGGETVMGRPYFVMELVNGLPITKYCDDHQLSLRERLALFVPVCEAVQHAHQKGIIHRDIKPSNVLVATNDGRPVPKVIDFGVAKALGERLTERTLVTNVGGIVGTLEYMSPEQADFGALDIDTRADVYSLGVLLYELLTASTPLTKHRVKEVALTEVLRLIREEEPQKPSSRLAATRESLSSIFTLRKTDPRNLTRELCGELDWIVMKCLEKDRTRRYATANGLARDIQRFLNDEPIEASPPSATYKLRKFARKHRKLLWAVGAFTLLLVSAVVTLTIALFAVNRERQAKELALQDEGRRRKQTREALDAMSSQVFADWLAKQKVLLPEHKQFLDMGLRYYEEFAADTGDQEESRLSAARAFERLGSIRDRLGQYHAAEAAWQREQEMYVGLVADFPGVPAYRLGHANSHGRLGILFRNRGRVSDAENSLGQALALCRDLATDFPAVPAYRNHLALNHNQLGVLLKNAGRREDAENAYDQALAILRPLVAEFPAEPEYRDNLAQVHWNLGVLFANVGKSQEAIGQHAEALSNSKHLATNFPSVLRYRELLADSGGNFAEALRVGGRYSEAEEGFHQALTVCKQLVADFPVTPEYRRGLAIVLSNMGILLKDTGRVHDAEDFYTQALAIHKKLAADFPAIPDHQNEAAGAMVNLARLLLTRKELQGSRRLLEDASVYHHAALKASPRHPGYCRFYRNNRWRLTETLLELKDHAAAAGTAAQFLEAAVEPPRDAYTAACLLAGCVRVAVEQEDLIESKRQELVTIYGDSAIAALRLAIERGAKEVTQAKTDPKLDPLRSRQDFRKLLLEMEGKKEP